MNERTAEMVAYAVAAFILVAGGVLMRTFVLNWFVGPVIVVATVTLLTPLLHRGRSP
jgi:hypothetical protein